MTKKNKLPDFTKMTRAEEAAWFDSHDLGKYEGELTPVDVVIELAKPKEEMLVLRVSKDVKMRLEKKAKDKGLSTSNLARILLTEKLQTI